MTERDALQKIIAQEGGNFPLAPWDWRYYSEKRRKAEFDLDEAEIKPYFQLDRLIEAVFETARRLFGLSFTQASVPLYHPDARAWEVKDAQGRHLGLFVGDYFARDSKHSGAWMASLRDQEKLAGDVRPIILNVCNFSKPAAGEKALLSFEDARTLFHEFGHALHGLLSDVTYPLLAGTAVSSDFVELPSQLYEHWLEVPEILQAYARHAVTGEPCPSRSRPAAGRRAPSIKASPRWNTPPARWSISTSHSRRETSSSTSPRSSATASRISPCRRKSSCATAFRISSICSPAAAMQRPITPTCGRRCSTPTPSRRSRKPATRSIRRRPQRLRDFIYSAGNLRDPGEAYKAFRGRLPTAEAMLEKRGLTDTVPA